MDECNNEVQRLNPHIYNKEDDMHYDISDSESNVNPIESKPVEKDLFKHVAISSRNKEIGSILLDSELKLMLLRHWSLFESLSNSNFVVSKLTLWKEPGKKML
jgi:cell division control protein 45